MEVDPAPSEEKEKDSDKAKDSEAAKPAAPAFKYTAPVDPLTGDLLPEGTVFLRLLLLLAVIDAGDLKVAAEFAQETFGIISSANRRTMDQLAAKVVFYLARVYELQGRLAELQP